jgi:energy-coupling factor transporter transmembrane protein EcfT
MAVWTILAVFSNAISVFLCGINALNFQLIVWILTAIANLGLKIILARAFGPPGVVWGGALAFLFAIGLLAPHVRRLLTRMGASHRDSPSA